MRFILLVLLFLTNVTSYCQDTDIYYEKAFRELKGMLNDSIHPSFKRAVFITENAYDNNLNENNFNDQIKFISNLCTAIAKQGNLVYNESDKLIVEKYASVYRLMKDTVTFINDKNKKFKTRPFTYDFDDFWGEKDWSKMFVTKLLSHHSGNCHSLPFLYKIISEEVGVPSYLAMAPNHIYIKQQTRKTGWFNTELTSGQFPIDAWIMASGYIHLDAVQNRIYMDTLSQKQSIAVCLVDLAEGYKRKFGEVADLNFIKKSVDLALFYYPHYINAQVLRAECLKKEFERMMVSNKAEYPSDLFKNPTAKALFDEFQNLYIHIDKLGYRMMPKEMYLSWLADLKREKMKYNNKSAVNNFEVKR